MDSVFWMLTKLRNERNLLYYTGYGSGIAYFHQDYYSATSFNKDKKSQILKPPF